MYKSACSFLSTGLPKIFYLGRPHRGWDWTQKDRLVAKRTVFHCFLGTLQEELTIHMLSSSCRVPNRTAQQNTLRFATMRLKWKRGLPAPAGIQYAVITWLKIG